MPWQNTMIKDIPRDVDALTGAVTPNGLTSVLATAPHEDQPWLRDIMLAGGVYLLIQERRKMLARIAACCAEPSRRHDHAGSTSEKSAAAPRRERRGPHACAHGAHEHTRQRW